MRSKTNSYCGVSQVGLVVNVQPVAARRSYLRNEDLDASGLISDDAIRTVDETAKTLLALVEHRVEPFGDAGLPWLHGLGHSAT